MRTRYNQLAHPLWSLSSAVRFQERASGMTAAANPTWVSPLCWESRTPLAASAEVVPISRFARTEEMARLEAVLLLARSPLSSRKLAQLADLADGTKARTLVRTLNGFYDQEGCAFRVEEVAGGFQLLTRAKFAPWLRRLCPAEQWRFSPPVLETLAVVAYRQPVLRAEIEAIRGVQCDEVLRQLIEKDLVRVVGRAEELGRPLLYGTTRRFLQLFGLRHLGELPRTEIFPTAELSDDRSTTDKQTLTQQDSPLAEEENNVKHSLNKHPFDPTEAAAIAAVALAERAAKRDDDYDDEEDEDYDDEEDEDYDDEEDEDFDDFDDEEDDTWEEVEDDEELDEDEEVDDEDFDDEDWDDEDEDWDDDDEDWDDEDEDYDDEEDE